MLVWVTPITRDDVDEGRDFLLSSELPPRLTDPRRIENFREKWKNARIQEDGLRINNREVVAQDEVEQIVVEAYNDPEQHGSRDTLHARLQLTYVGISRRMVMKVLERIESHQLHRAVPRAL